ncbi:MAG: hypothetical protein J0L96_10090 [Anaerolineae bacterium]|nr:hypothetical protein [Anaerolineae bacterium]
MNVHQGSNQYIQIAKKLSIPLGVISLCLLLVMLLPYINQYNYMYVSRNFAEALMQNDSRLAHRLSAPSQRERIDEWMENREPIKCDFSLDPIGVSIGSSFEGMAYVSFFKICQDADQYFDFEIDEIILEKQDYRWTVIDWK